MLKNIRRQRDKFCEAAIRNSAIMKERDEALEHIMKANDKIDFANDLARE